MDNKFKNIYENYNCISVIGAGGKTTLIANMAEDLQNEKVIITTTTKIYKPNNVYVLTDFDENSIKNAMEERNIIALGQDIGEKLGCMPFLVYDIAAKYADRMLIEADGAKRMPMKVPNAKEPVYIANTDCVVAVLGLSAINKPLIKVCHRHETAAKMLNKSVFDEVSAKDLVDIILHKDGIFHNAPNVRKKVVFSQIDAVEAKELLQLEVLKEYYDVYFVRLNIG